MREAIGGISIFQLVIFFILLFTGIMCLTINSSKAYAVKDEIITLIESPGSGAASGNIDGLLDQIIAKINDAGYRSTGNSCPNGYIGYDRNGRIVNNNIAFCIRAVSSGEKYVNSLIKKCSEGEGCIPISGSDSSKSDFPGLYYYDIILFYQLDVPLVNRLFNFRVTGSTKVINK